MSKIRDGRRSSTAATVRTLTWKTRGDKVLREIQEENRETFAFVSTRRRPHFRGFAHDIRSERSNVPCAAASAGTDREVDQRIRSQDELQGQCGLGLGPWNEETGSGG